VIFAKAILRIAIMVSAVIVVFPGAIVFAANPSLEDQVVKILTVESSRGPVKAGVLEIRYFVVDNGAQITKEELQSFEDGLAEQLNASLIREIDKSGKRGILSIIERDRLDVIFKEKMLQVTGLTEVTAPAIGGLAGLDVILLGTVRGNHDNSTTTIKVIRVKDGEILGMAEHSKSRKKLIDNVTDVHAHSTNGLPLHLAEGGTVTFIVTVEQGNPINISLMTSADYDKFNRDKKHKQLADFEAKKTKRYRRSAYLVEGEYVLVLGDKALGVASHQKSDVRVTAYVEPD